jgi:hypothetical protein
MNNEKSIIIYQNKGLKSCEVEVTLNASTCLPNLMKNNPISP